MPNVSYGRGMTGLGQLNCDGTFTRGLESIIRDVYHMLVTVRGSLPVDPEVGLGLIDRVLTGVTADTIPAIATDIEGELAKDERIDSSDANVTIDANGGLVIDVQVVLAKGPSFRLIGPIGAVRAELISNGS